MTTPRPVPSLPTAVDQAYSLWIWLDERVMGLPAHARAAVGARVLDATLDALDLLLSAAYEPKSSAHRPEYLRRANQRLAFLRFLLRGLRDRRHLSLDQHAHAVGMVDALGRQVGAWARTLG